MNEIIIDITRKSKQANKLLSTKSNSKGHQLLKEIYFQINKNPKIINYINDYETLAYSFLLIYMDKLYDSTESKKIIELAYTFISLAIKKNTSKPYNLRIAILKHGENIFIEDILDFWKLRDITLGRVAAIMIFNNLLVTDIENISELYLEQPFFKKLNNQLDDAINSALFHPLYSKDKIAESGFDLHKMLLENLMKN